MATTTTQASTGPVLSAGHWLDAHFAASRDEYLAMLDAAPISEGSIVLDAGCGSGAFLPFIDARAGAGGRIIAVDLTTSQLSAIGGWSRTSLPALRLAAGSVESLPFQSSVFNLTWCANVTQYFDDAGLQDVLKEFSRVTAPGGFVALKDSDMTGWRIEPAPPFLGLHLAEASSSGDATSQSIGSVRGRRLRRCMEEAGFEQVVQRTHVIERWAPLNDSERQFWAEWLVYLAAVSSKHALPSPDTAFWHSVATKAEAEAFVSRPDFYGCEMQAAVVGRKPEAGR